MSKEMRNHIDKFKDFLLREQDENSNFEDFEGVNEYIFILYFDVSAGNIPQSEYDDVLHRALIEEFDGFGKTFYLKDYFTPTNPSFEVKIIKNEWVGNKNHVFDYIKTTIKVEIPKYEDFTIEDVEETIKNKLGSFYHRWNISYDEREKVHIWLKKLERVG
jgi:hypothetical protein